jgi:hypothetical protein
MYGPYGSNVTGESSINETFGSRLALGARIQVLFSFNFINLITEVDKNIVFLSRDLSYLKIVSLFADLETAPLSLHQIAQCGETLGKPVGSWLGPNTVCQALKKLLSAGTSSVDLCMHIAMDSTLVTSEVKRLCMAHPSLNPLSPSTITSSYIINTPR